MADGRIKLYLTWCALQWRRRWREVFRDGDYLPLAIAGRDAEHVCAYARRHGERIAITVVPRLLARHRGDAAADVSPTGAWADTRIELPAEWGGQPWFNTLTGETLAPAGPPPALAVAALLAHFPVALLVCDHGGAASWTEPLV